ncbi:MAG: SAM-dependent methyltransferase [Myxococcota bacterium]
MTRVLASLVPLALTVACSSSPPPAAEPPVPEPPSVAKPLSEPEPEPEVTPLSATQIEAIVAAEDRTDRDRKTDERRQPAELLGFMKLRPGMKVADIGAGTGYTTELLARAVGSEGTVYGQNPTFVLERFAEEGWSARLATPPMANVVRLDREFDDPFPADLRDLDMVVNIMFYHDFAWQEVDRAAHCAAVFDALRPGGEYVLVDHSAADGAGVSGSKTLHRVEEALVRAELEAVGFELIEQADFFRNPADTRDWNALPWRGEREELSDRFVLKFRKPAAA